MYCQWLLSSFAPANVGQKMSTSFQGVFCMEGRFYFIFYKPDRLFSNIVILHRYSQGKVQCNCYPVDHQTGQKKLLQFSRDFRIPEHTLVHDVTR